MSFRNTPLFLLVFSIFLLSTGCANHHNSESNAKAVLRENILKIIDSSKGKIGVAFKGLDFNDSIVINGGKQYPMQSVYKFPQAMAVLKKVDNGKFTLDQKIHIPKDSLDKNTWSPMLADFPDRDIDISLADLLRYTVSKSDNNGCDALFRMTGGPLAVNNYIHSLGIKDIDIVATEAQMHKDWKVQYTNWCKPWAMTELLEMLYSGKNMSKTSRDFLMKLMLESENSPKRLKGLLPEKTMLAHKTGTGDQNPEGLYAATNDVGIFTLPNGKHYAIVVYVSGCKGEIAQREFIIARISKLVWDYCTVMRSE